MTSEYKRNGTANLFVFLDAHRSWRRVKVTDSRTAVDFAACMRELVDIDFPEAERIRVVLDNLSTHTANIQPARSIKPSPPARHAGCCSGWSSTTSPSMPAG
jgi:DDE superfamily endonuclease